MKYKFKRVEEFPEHVKGCCYAITDDGHTMLPGDVTRVLNSIKSEQPPTWETVETWEKRTGMVYPDDGPVWYYRLAREPKKREWVLKQFKNVKKYYNCGVNDRFIIANHLGKPPADWRPE